MGSWDELDGIDNHIFSLGSLCADDHGTLASLLEMKPPDGAKELRQWGGLILIDLDNARSLAVMDGDGHSLGAPNIGIVGNAHLVEPRCGELRGEGGRFLALFFLHVMDVTRPHKGRCVDAVLPIADKLGLRIVDDDAWQSGLVSDDEGKVLGLVDLIGAGQGRHLIGRQAHDK